jgi:hypothetical protein
MQLLGKQFRSLCSQSECWNVRTLEYWVLEKWKDGVLIKAMLTAYYEWTLFKNIVNIIPLVTIIPLFLYCAYKIKDHALIAFFIHCVVLTRWLHKIFRFTQVAMMKTVASVN